MKKHNFKIQPPDLIFALAVLIMLAALVSCPAVSVSAAGEGLAMCAGTVIPSLFPFFVVSSMAVRSKLPGAAGRAAAPLMSPLFHLGGGCSAALILGILGGYPVGAKTTAELYASGVCTKNEAEHMLAFCNNCGPAFILGIAGAGLYKSAAAGFFLLGIHILSSMLSGILLRGQRRSASQAKPARTETKPLSFSEIFTEAVKGSAGTLIGICGFIVFFSVVIRLLEASGLFSLPAYFLGNVLNIPAENINAVLRGCIELSSGILALQNVSNLRFSLTAASFIFGWGGLSVHFQTMSVINGSGLSLKKYFKGKLLHGVIAAALTYPLSGLIPLNAPVFAQEPINGTLFLRANTVPVFFILISLALAVCLFFILSVPYSKRHNKSVKK